MKKLITTMTLMIASLVSMILQAQQMSPEEQAAATTETRQAVFKLLGFHMGPIGAMARGQMDFDADLAKRNAERIAVLGTIIPDVFASDTREFDVVTRALDKIWDNKADFEAHAAELVKQAQAFAEAASSGDRATTLGALRPLGSACGDCHDDYRFDP